MAESTDIHQPTLYLFVLGTGPIQRISSISMNCNIRVPNKTEFIDMRIQLLFDTADFEVYVFPWISIEKCTVRYYV